MKITNVDPTVTIVKTANPTSIPESGGAVTFTYLITNTSFEPVDLTSLTDNKLGDLLANENVTWADDFKPTDKIPAGKSVTATLVKTFAAGDINAGQEITNVGTVVVTDNDGTTGTANDDATVKITNVDPTVDLTKTVDPTSMPEPGGVFTYTLTIKNTCEEPIQVTDFTDTNSPSLTWKKANGDTISDITVYWIPVGSYVTAEYTETWTDAGDYPNKADVTVIDNDGSTASDAASTLAKVTDVKPTIDITKTADPGSLPEPGGDFKFTITIKNTSVEPVEITELTDTQYDLSDYIGTWLKPNEVITINYTLPFTEVGTYVNTAAVTVKDNEGNTASDSDDATVKVLPVLTAWKFYDRNANGLWDEGEPGIQGWKIQVYNASGTLVETKYTNADGKVTFVLAPGKYTVKEVMAVGSWMATTQKSFTLDVQGGLNEVKFGNLCLGAGGGHTPGYWSNKNGEADMKKMGMSACLAELRTLNLRQPTGTSFDPTTYSQFKTWLQARNAVDMRYQLSGHLAAMWLNVKFGYVKADALVYAGPTLGYRTIGLVMNEANATLALSNPDRTYLGLLKDALDKANNNYNFVQYGPCPVKY